MERAQLRDGAKVDIGPEDEESGGSQQMYAVNEEYNQEEQNLEIAREQMRTHQQRPVGSGSTFIILCFFTTL